VIRHCAWAPPAAPVQVYHDEDIVISQAPELDPFPGLAASANCVSFRITPKPAACGLRESANKS